MEEAETPTGVRVAAAFFAVGGVLELALAAVELPSPVPFWPAWEALGRSLLYAILAFGLLHRLALCRTIALIYCLAALVTYGVALGMAFAQAPVRFPASVVWKSLYEVPSCTLLLPYLRSAKASLHFHRALF